MLVSFKYVGDGEREIPAAAITVKPGETFEVDGEIAKGLEGQESFEKVKKSTAPRAPKDGE